MQVPPAEAVAQALQVTDGPVVLVDSADNVGGGAPGDGTVLLGALLRERAKGAVIPIVDPGVVAAARQAGEGAIIT
ncbi:MAG TPA: MlrC C-terminal domain-containing protein, partial [bacterium]|nr:MlrC C-terminal domain-containing protein [bacterium]